MLTERAGSSPEETFRPSYADYAFLQCRMANRLSPAVRDVTAEQGRWMDINNRLDDLERALVRR